MSEILSILWNFFTNPWVIINNIICFALTEWSFRKLDLLYKKSEDQIIRDQKYPSFVRNDNVKRPVFYLMAPLLTTRLLMGYGSLAVISILIFFLSLTHEKGTPYTGWKFTVISIMCKTAARMNLLCAGFVWIEEETIEYDYK